MTYVYACFAVFLYGVLYKKTLYLIDMIPLRNPATNFQSAKHNNTWPCIFVLHDVISFLATNTSAIQS